MTISSIKLTSQGKFRQEFCSKLRLSLKNLCSQDLDNKCKQIIRRKLKTDNRVNLEWAYIRLWRTAEVIGSTTQPVVMLFIIIPGRNETST